MAFFCHIISSKRDLVNSMKMEEVMNWPRPFTPTDISSFLGLVCYCRRFEDCFASIASPLTTLTQKSVKFEWL